MSRMQIYISELVETHGESVEFIKSTYDEKTLSLVPDILKEFYAEYEKIELPFGEIDAIEIAIKHSEAEPFKSEKWFCFGFDGYFSFWLCRFEPDEQGLSITTWDHDSGCEIGEAVYADIIEFLEDMRSDYEESERENN